MPVQERQKYLGNFVHTSDSTSNIELDPDPAPTEEVIAAVKKYQQVFIKPTYFSPKKAERLYECRLYRLAVCFQ
ncbi:hypothetical protein [Paraflavitalea speifideaquila]|uniref:hypothetical protein n=1 Tax=Paraflavitalea speifideaquila TaxID=3076558 RepID=UPI0028E3628C|nr:hypothetical protein [Paraflavitalea speifideiaquila]